MPCAKRHVEGSDLEDIDEGALAPPLMAKLFWLEAVIPLGIIAGMLCVMGNAQYYIHRAVHGRPKHIGNDVWDVAMERRDKKLMDQFSGAQN
ncbi:hypothetical protein C4D60_Mb07t05540 [Musa balbisiana]|uniref:NADH dehydrogenase [ubiquinone] 1 alpha subcomplex subunit 1 n=1 Tax=Musa balbisiana TaxID=52838 RepID=A0A4S8JD74_MUSBA|nr:hypothetical protein C4D60_Mb07t05540 [Musa balbisiana]